MAWSCEQCGRNVVSNDLMCDLCHAAKPGADPAKVALGGQRDLIMEAHLRALALWQRVGAVLLVAFMLLSFVAGAALSRSFGNYSSLVAGVFVYFLVFGVVIAAGSFLLGHFLAQYSNGARITAGVLSAIGVAWFLLSTALQIIASSHSSYGDYEYGSGYGRHSYYGSSSSGVGFFQVVFFILYMVWAAAVLWALFNRRSANICTPAYRDIVARTPELRPSTFKSPFFIIPAGLTVFVFLLMLVIILPRL